MTDWDGPADESYFIERQRRLLNGGANVEPMRG